MCPLLVCILCSLLAIPAYTKEVVSVRGKSKIVLESVKTNFDSNYLEYFHKVPNQELYHSFRVIKSAPSFTISFSLRALNSQKTIYNINNLDGCQFLSNPLMNKLMMYSYRAVMANSSFKCPILPKVYYLKNVDTTNIIPTFHPVGHFEIKARIQVPKSSLSYISELIWKYNVMHLK